MKEKLRGLMQRWGKSGDRRYRWLVWLGLLGILLVGLSEWIPGEGDASVPGDVPVSASAVETAMEQRITGLLSRVQGVGTCYVMVTLEQGVQQVYAADTNGVNSTQTLHVATEQGLVGLPITQIQPVIKGVAVVCNGGDDPAVNKRITDLITAVFHIASHRVFVTKANE